MNSCLVSCEELAPNLLKMLKRVTETTVVWILQVKLINKANSLITKKELHLSWCHITIIFQTLHQPINLELWIRQINQCIRSPLTSRRKPRSTNRETSTALVTQEFLELGCQVLDLESMVSVLQDQILLIN